MVQFGALLEEAKHESFDDLFRQYFVDYEELKRILEEPGTLENHPQRFEQSLDSEIEKACLFALGRVGYVAEVLREGGDIAAAREAMSVLLATLRFVELNLIAVRKIVKKRDKKGRLGGGRQRAAWLLSSERSRHLEGLQSLEPQIRALLVSANSIRESRVITTITAPHRNEGISVSPKFETKSQMKLKNSSESCEKLTSMMGPLLASGDAADARALAELIKKCDQALAAASAARRDLRQHSVAITALGVDADVDYARTLLETSVQKSLDHHLRQVDETVQSESSLLNDAAMRFERMGFPRVSSFLGRPYYKRRGGDHERNYQKYYHYIALRAQCASAALYSASCYAAAPGILAVVLKLRQPRYFAGILLAASPLATLAARYAAQEAIRRSSNLGYKSPILLGGAACCAGNLMYGFAILSASSRKWYAKNYMVLIAYFARILIGFSGGADAVNREYIGTINMAPAERGAAAARYYAADAIGAALGFVLTAFVSGGQVRYVHHLATPSFVLAIALAFHAILVAIFWRESAQQRIMNNTNQNSAFILDESRAGPRLSSQRGTLTLQKKNDYGSSFEIEENSHNISVASNLLRTTSSPYRDYPNNSQNEQVSKCRFQCNIHRWIIGRLFVSGLVIELLLISSSHFVEIVFGWSARLTTIVLCLLRLSGLPTRQRAQEATERVDERCLSFGGAIAAFLAVIVLAGWPVLLAPEKSPRQNQVLLWLAAAVVTLSSVEAMAVADRALMVKLSPLDARKGVSVNADLFARVIGDLSYALALAAVRTVYITNAALWTIPAILLAIVAVSAASGLNLFHFGAHSSS